MASQEVNGIPLHESFSDPRSEIRLLEIDEKHSDEFRWKMSIFSLKENPHFTALSYVWGDPAATERITVNGHFVSVTANLASALRHIYHHWRQEFGSQSHTGKFRLWADALCINQKDVQEKNHQVPLMRSTYSSANPVICWLSTTDPQIHLAFDTIQLLHTEWEKLSIEELLTFDWIRSHPSLRVTPEEEYPLNHRWEAIQQFTKLTYFRRTWILQEVVLGKKVIIACDNRAIEWPQVQSVVERATTLSDKIGRGSIDWPTFICPNIWKAIKSVRVHWAPILFFFYAGAHRTRFRESDPTTIDWQLAAVAGRILQATNPKGHVYGLMGIFRIHLVPDYNENTSVAIVYRDYVCAWLKDWKLGLCGNVEEHYFLLYSGSYLGEPELKPPSWVPNFPALSTHRQAIYDGNRQFGELITDGRADYSVFPPDTEESSIIDTSLFVSGLDIGPITNFEEYGDYMSRVSIPTIKYIQEFISEVPIYADRSPSLQMVFRLFCRKSYRMGQPLNADGLIKALGFLETLLGLDPDDPPLDYDLRKKYLGSFGLVADNAGAFATSFINIFAPPDHSEDDSDILDILYLWYNSKGGFSSADMGLDDVDLVIIINICLDHLQQANRGAAQVLFRMGPYIGVSQRGIQVGDRVCVLKGSNTLSVLRRTPDDGDFYTHVAPCFVVGLMNGEAETFLEGNSSKVQRLEIR
ncbi:HET-domain-containing protein [Hypoxylon sp. EC38]|nr:HET-domain-containing protein [Hypoxylon sp. EC38]